MPGFRYTYRPGTGAREEIVRGVRSGQMNLVMIDVVDYRSPLGPIGSLVDRIRLERYMIGLLETRNEFLRPAAEASIA